MPYQLFVIVLRHKAASDDGHRIKLQTFSAGDEENIDTINVHRVLLFLNAGFHQQIGDVFRVEHRCQLFAGIAGGFFYVS